MMRLSTFFSRLFFIVGVAITTAIISNFFKFADAVFAEEKIGANPKADGIAALTGGSKDRLINGVRLLEGGYGKRLLISGVYSKATAEELRKVTGGKLETYECCVDIGKSARDTIGNGREIAAWAKKNKFKKVIIVTDNYHMQRSLLEIQNSAPDLELIPFKASAEPYISKEWWKSPSAVKGLSLEYYKYIGAQMRIKFGFNPEKARQ